MKKILKIYWQTLIIPLFIAIFVFSLFLILFPRQKPLLGMGNSSVTLTKKMNKKVIHYVAIGDSLTEGIGDQTNSGGFVPLVANDLEENYQLNGVQVENYGKNGDRSDQILKRIKKNHEIQKSLTSADIITVTVGGNDLMQVFSKNMLSLTVATFKQPAKHYEQKVTSLLEEIRSYNKKAPIYILGIYNPFYLYFPDIKEIQEIVDDWNIHTLSAIEKQNDMYFISINNLLYKGINNKTGIVAEDSSNKKNMDITNDALYEEDHFHPNNLGYQLMAKAIRKELDKTQKNWFAGERELDN